MKYLLLFVFISSFYLVPAQIAFNTGSVQLDADLNIINTQARADVNSFRSDMKLSYNISDNKLNYMSVNLHMTPGDIYLSLEISKIARISLDRVLPVYKTYRSKGWGVIAKQLGIKPGSAEFHQLKNGTRAKKSKGSVKKHKNKGKKH